MLDGTARTLWLLVVRTSSLPPGVAQIQAEKDALKKAKADAKAAEKASAKEAKNAEKAAAKGGKQAAKGGKKDKKVSSCT
jgi:hypothetical protein